MQDFIHNIQMQSSSLKILPRWASIASICDPTESDQEFLIPINPLLKDLNRCQFNLESKTVKDFETQKLTVIHRSIHGWFIFRQLHSWDSSSVTGKMMYKNDQTTQPTGIWKFCERRFVYQATSSEENTKQWKPRLRHHTKHSFTWSWLGHWYQD